MDILAPKRKLLEHAFTTPNHNGNLYNAENDNPVNDRAAESLQLVGNDHKVTRVDSKRLQHAKLGDKVKYFGGEGKVVAREGYNLKVFNEVTDVVEMVPISNTIFQSEVLDDIELKMWDRMNFDMRQSILAKVNITSRDFVGRDWHDLPRELQTVLKDAANLWSEPSRGGFAGREPGITRDSESQSFRDRINPRHVMEPQKDGTADALKDTQLVTKPIRGHDWGYWNEKLRDEYPDEKTRGAVIGSMEQEDKSIMKSDIKQNPEGIIGEDEDGKVSAKTNMAAITGDNDREGHKEERSETKSDEERGMYGGISTEVEPLDATDDYEEKPLQTPNVGQKEIDSAPTGQTSTREDKDPRAERDQIGYNQDPLPDKIKACEICDGDHKTEDHINKEGLTSNSIAVANPVYGDKQRKKALKIRNEFNTRWGPRYGVTAEEYEELKKYNSRRLLSKE